MASELRVNTLKDAAGNNSIATSFVAGGSAKVWVTFDGEASGATVRDSLNVSSTDDDGTGLYGVNFGSAMSTANYSSVCGRGGFAYVTSGAANANFPTTGAITKLQTYSDNGSLSDRTNITAHVLGDLA